MRLQTADAQLIDGESSILDQSQPGMIAFSEISEKKKIKIMVPYKIDADVKVVVVRSEVRYKTPQGEFIYGDSHRISALLPLGVNVQDIFKHSALFSKFAISSATYVPLRVLNCHLDGTLDFKATTPSMDREGLYVFAKQPVSMVYRILQTGNTRDSRELQTRLSMLIDYQCLDEEIVTAIEASLVESLGNGEFSPFVNLLRSHLLQGLSSKLPTENLELIGLLREVNLAPYSEYSWDKVLFAVPEPTRSALVKWLEEWHKVC